MRVQGQFIGHDSIAKDRTESLKDQFYFLNKR